MQYVTRAAWRLKPSPNRWFVQQLVKKKQQSFPLLALWDGNPPMTCSGQWQRKQQTLHYWPFAMGIYRWPVDSHRIGPVIRKAFSCLGVSCCGWFRQVCKLHLQPMSCRGDVKQAISLVDLPTRLIGSLVYPQCYPNISFLTLYFKVSG